MSTMIHEELDKLGIMLMSWRVQLQLMWGVALVLTTVLILGLFDVVFQAGMVARWASFMLLVALLGGLVFLLAHVIRRRSTPDGLATLVERAFPELDNHLINYIQFTRDASGNPFKLAYVQGGAPSLSNLEVTRMKNQRAHRNGLIALSAAAILLMAPALFWGNAWSTAVWRMINPLSDAAPLSLTRIILVDPGDTEIQQGQSIMLSSQVQGMRNHSVRVDVHPNDARATTYDLGKIAGERTETFSYRVPRVNTGFRYRFRAGDSPPSDWYVVTPRPPPAFTGIAMAVVPPEYMGLRRVTYQMNNEREPIIPEGSTVYIATSVNTTMQGLNVITSDQNETVMQYDHEIDRWTARVDVAQPGSIRIEGHDRFDQSLTETIAYDFKSDQPPRIAIFYPEGRTVLPPGERPRIDFSVTDDFGLQSVHIERMDRGVASDEPGTVLATWDNLQTDRVDQLWHDEPVRRETAVAYRIVAVDNRVGDPQITRSAPVVFNIPPAERTQEVRHRMEEQSTATLHRVIELQRENLAQSLSLQRQADALSDEVWRDPENRQREVRNLTRELLRSPIRPLGGRTESIAQLYANEMVLAINALENIQTTQTEEKPRAAARAVELQGHILRQLEAAIAAMDKARVDRRMTGIMTQLNALIEGQGRVIDQTESVARSGGNVSPALVDEQDALSEDVAQFQQACESESSSVRGSDPAFADKLIAVLDASRTRRIREDMLMAAERLEDNLTSEALEYEQRALSSLTYLHGMLEEVGVQRQKEHRADMIAALAQAQEKIRRMEENYRTVQQTVETLRGHTDKSDELFDVLPEEYMELIKKDKETLLTIPEDLHVFSDLNSGNELVEDIFSVFEEVEQAAGSEEWDADDVVQLLMEKNMEAIEAMNEMMDAFDMIERFLLDTPDALEVLTETIDREEMPDAGIALGALQAAMEDLIGDLLETTEALDQAADDSATTHAFPDIEDLGFGVAEGDLSSFAAVGSTGNEKPDHKEQDGRGNIGREGMSVGETAAGSGTIEEGDPNIEERRTEDPTMEGQVDLDGETQTEATGGGKLATGKADEFGMDGGAKRMDSTEEGSTEGMAALLARDAEAIMAQASMENIRVDSLRSVAHHLRQADDAIAKGDIRQLHEHHRMAQAALQRARVELEAGTSGAMNILSTPNIIRDAVQAGSDVAPPQFQSQVAEYYKLLNEDF